METNKMKDNSKLFMLFIIICGLIFIIYNEVYVNKENKTKITGLETEVDSLVVLNVVLEKQIDSLIKSKAKVKEKIIYIKANRDEQIRVYNNLDTSERVKFLSSWIDEEIPDPGGDK